MIAFAVLSGLTFLKADHPLAVIVEIYVAMALNFISCVFLARLFISVHTKDTENLRLLSNVHELIE
jgi:hypothetical protein